MKTILIGLALIALATAQTITAGNLYTFAGGSGPSGLENAPAKSTKLNFPSDIVFDSKGNGYISESFSCVVRKVSGGKISTFLGISGQCGVNGEGKTAAQTRIQYPEGLTVDSNDNIYVADAGSNRVLKIDAQTSIVSRVFGNGKASVSATDCAVNSTATSCDNNYPISVAVTPDGKTLWVSIFHSSTIYKVDLTSGLIAAVFSSQLAHSLRLDSTAANLFLANFNPVILSLNTANSQVNRIAGIGAIGFSGDGASALLAKVNQPSCVSPKGNEVVINDFGNIRIRKIDITGNISTIAGAGILDTALAENVIASTSNIGNALRSRADGNGNVFFTQDNGVIRMIAGVTVPSQSTCGNGVKDPTEDCDDNSVCCVNCKFAAATTICRPSAGSCDIAETCSGTSSTCGTDQFKAAGTACNELFGVCDLTVPSVCSGTSAKCTAPPSMNIKNIQHPANFFTVMSFGGITGNLGSVDGTMACKGDIGLGNGFSIAQSVFPPQDGLGLFNLVAGKNLNWVGGTLFPIQTYPGLFGKGSGIATGTIAVPTTTTAQITSGTGLNFDTEFNNAQTYYNSLQDRLSKLNPNVKATLSGSTLFLECASDSPLYVASVDATIFNQVTSWTRRGCNSQAGWIVNIQSTVGITFQGDYFPAISEKTVFNVVGAVTVTVKAEVHGTIMAPKCDFVHTSGTIKGNLIVATVKSIVQVAKPQCGILKQVDLYDYTRETAPKGSSCIHLVSGGGFIVGDVVTFPSGTGKISTKTFAADGTATICFTTPFGADIPAQSRVTTSFDPNTAGSRMDVSPPFVGTAPIPNPPKKNAGSTLTTVLALVMVPIVLLL